MTRTTSRSRWLRLALTLVALASLAAIGPVAALAQSEAPAASPAAPASPVAPSQAPATICDPASPDMLETCLATATPIEPDDSLTSPTPVPFDHVTVSADGRTLTVYFWMGVQECNGLHSVEVEPLPDGGITLTVLTGIPEDAISRICIELAQLYSTVVTLDEPLIVPGAAS
jgi:hypothetical protein